MIRILSVMTAITCFQSHALVSMKLDKMNSFLNEIHLARTIPQKDIQLIDISPSTAEVPEAAKREFVKIEFAIFGTSNVFMLKSCSDCIFMNQYSNRTIYVQPSEVEFILKTYGKDNGAVILQMVIAHEFAHVIQEASLGQNADPSLDINGLPAQSKLSTIISTESAFRSNYDQYCIIHTEVDAYALLILKRLSIKKPSIVLHYLKHLTSRFINPANENSWMYKQDLQGRLLQDSVVMEKLWP